MQKLTFYGCLIFCTLTACSAPKKETHAYEKPYDGPMVEAYNVTTLYTDTAILRSIIKAPVQQEMQNGDRVFPKGLDMVTYYNNGAISGTLKADYGILYKDKPIFTVRGNVRIENPAEKNKLTSEEMNYDSKKKIFYTDKFVIISSPKETVRGYGMTATHDYKKYKIKKVTGIVSGSGQ